MTGPASDLARRLGEKAEAVCRYYLSNGRREGRYWLIGDVLNTPGRSLYVRLRGPAARQREPPGSTPLRRMASASFYLEKARLV